MDLRQRTLPTHFIYLKSIVHQRCRIMLEAGSHLTYQQSFLIDVSTKSFTNAPNWILFRPPAGAPATAGGVCSTPVIKSNVGSNWDQRRTWDTNFWSASNISLIKWGWQIWIRLKQMWRSEYQRFLQRHKHHDDEHDSAICVTNYETNKSFLRIWTQCSITFSHVEMYRSSV